MFVLGESQSRSNGHHVLPFVKLLQDQSLLALYSRLFAGVPAHYATVPFPLAVADKSARRTDHHDVKLSPSSSTMSPSLCDYSPATSLRYHPYMHDALARRHFHASSNHR